MESLLGLVGAGVMASCVALAGLIPFGATVVFGLVNVLRPSPESKRWGLASAALCTLLGGLAIGIEVSLLGVDATPKALLIGGIFAVAGLAGSVVGIMARPADGPRQF